MGQRQPAGAVRRGVVQRQGRGWRGRRPTPLASRCAPGTCRDHPLHFRLAADAGRRPRGDGRRPPRRARWCSPHRAGTRRCQRAGAAGRSRAAGPAAPAAQPAADPHDCRAAAAPGAGQAPCHRLRAGLASALAAGRTGTGVNRGFFGVLASRSRLMRSVCCTARRAGREMHAPGARLARRDAPGAGHRSGPLRRARRTGPASGVPLSPAAAGPFRPGGSSRPGPRPGRLRAPVRSSGARARPRPRGGRRPKAGSATCRRCRIGLRVAC
jgi:hypothetical protein